jgi:hypothetical protein
MVSHLVSSPICGSWPNMYYSLTVTVLFCEAPSLTRGWVCLLYMLVALASIVFLGSESLGTCDHILLSQIFETSLFVASYDLQGHGGGIWSHLHTGVNWTIIRVALYNLHTDHAQKTRCYCCAGISRRGQVMWLPASTLGVWHHVPVWKCVYRAVT